MYIIVKGKSPEEILLGLLLDRDLVKRATVAIYKAIEESFEEDERRQNRRIERTPEAVKHRFDLAFKLALRLLGDYNMSVASLRVRLPRALRSELAGIEYAPSDRLVVRAP